MICRICSGGLLPVLDLGEQYIATHLLPTQSKRYPLCMCQCQDCGVVQLSCSVPLDEMFRLYWYRSAVNESMVRVLEDIVVESIAKATLKPGDSIIDIGSNDWTLLDRMPRDMQRFGVDPSDIATERIPDGVTLIRDYFPPKTELPQAQIITAIAMFYDVESPVEFLREVSRLLQPWGVFVLQMAHLGLMLRETAFDNICHEHLFYYSAQDIIDLCSKVGLRVFDARLNSVNGGSMQLWVDHGERKPSPEIEMVLESEVRDSRLLLTFKDRAALRVAVIRDRLERWKQEGRRVHALGASTKGQVFLQYAGITEDLVQAVEERNQRKIGRKTLTGIPIIGEGFGKSDCEIKLVLPWHFMDSIVKREKAFLDRGGLLVAALPDYREVKNAVGGHVL